MPKITHIVAREILDSRGIPTVETRVVLDSGIETTASSPSGEELGTNHAVELRDGDKNRYQGLGVLKAVAAVNTIIAPKLIGMEVSQQGVIDKTMIQLDGTPNKSQLGANATLTVSFATAKATAKAYGLPLYQYLNQLTKVILPDTPLAIPTPIFNIINGGKHGAGNLDFQEYHVVPASAKSYPQALQIGVTVYQALKQILITRNATYSIGDEGGFAPNLYTNVDAIEALTQAVKKTPYRVGVDVFLGLDIAASHFKTEHGYRIKDRPVAMQAAEFIEYLKDLNKEYHLLLLEDPLGEDAWNEWQLITQELQQSLLIVGDDLLASNSKLLQQAITQKACSAILVKPNQVGTLSETLQLIQIARKGQFKVILSHRSGETNDDFVADFAVGVGAEYVKFGAPVRGERIAKYNRLSAIHQELVSTAQKNTSPQAQ